MPHALRRRTLLALIFAALLGACGGGGSSPGPVVVLPEPAAVLAEIGAPPPEGTVLETECASPDGPAVPGAAAQARYTRVDGALRGWSSGGLGAPTDHATPLQMRGDRAGGWLMSHRTDAGGAMFRIAANGEKSLSPVPYAATFDVAHDGRIWFVRDGMLSVATQQGQVKTLATLGSGAATVDGPLGSSPVGPVALIAAGKDTVYLLVETGVADWAATPPASTVARSLRVMTRAAAGQDLWNLQTVPLPADIGPLDVVSAIRVGPADELLLLLNQPLRQTVAPAQPAPGTTEWVYDAAVSVRVLDRSGAWMTLATKPYTFTRRIVGVAMVATYALDARDLGVSPSGVVFVGGAGGIYEVDAPRGWTTVATPAGQPTDAIGRDGPVAAAGFAGAAQLIPDATGLVFYDGQTCQVRRLEGTQLSTLSGPKLAGPEFAGAGFLGENAAGALLIAHGAAPGPLAPSPRGRYATRFGLLSAQLDQPGFRPTPVRSLAATVGAPQCALSSSYRSSSGCTGIAPADGAVPGYWLGAGAAGPLARTGTQFQTGLATGAGTVMGSTAGWPGVLGGDAPCGPSGVHVAGNALHFFGWVRTDPPVASIVYHELRLYRVDLATGIAAVVAGATIDSPVFSGRRVDLSAIIPEGGGGPALIQRRSDGAYWLSNGKELWLLDTAGQLRRMAGLSTSGGGVDGSGTAASFGLIASIRVLPDNRLLVVDQGAHAVRLASDDGKVITLVGQLNQAGQMPGALPARLESPVDVWPIGRDLVITTMTSRRLLRASAAL